MRNATPGMRSPSTPPLQHHEGTNIRVDQGPDKRAYPMANCAINVSVKDNAIPKGMAH
jgi:hypothetical protein